MQISVALQRVSDKQLVAKDTVLLIAPAVFALLKYCNTPGNILAVHVPLKFGKPSEINVDSIQQSSMAKDDGSFDNKTLRELQWKNLLYMNNTSTQLTLCPGQVTAEEIVAKQRQKALFEKENIPLAIMPSTAPPPPLSPSKQQPHQQQEEEEPDLNDMQADEINDEQPATIVPTPMAPATKGNKRGRGKSKQPVQKKTPVAGQKRTQQQSASPSAIQKDAKRAKKSSDPIIDTGLIASAA